MIIRPLENKGGGLSIRGGGVILWNSTDISSRRLIKYTAFCYLLCQGQNFVIHSAEDRNRKSKSLLFPSASRTELSGDVENLYFTYVFLSVDSWPELFKTVEKVRGPQDLPR